MPCYTILVPEILQELIFPLKKMGVGRMGGRIVETKTFQSEGQRWRESVSEKIVVLDQ